MIFKWLLSELFTLNLFAPPVKILLPGRHKGEEDILALPEKKKEEVPALAKKEEA